VRDLVRGVPTWALALAVAVLVLVPGGAAVVLLSMSEEQKRVRQAARVAAGDYGVNPDFVEAIGYVESRWRMAAVNKTGSDGARGGSWGPFQLSAMTARAYGYTEPMEQLLTNPDLAAGLCARILSERPGGPPASLEDACAWWNAGQTSATKLGQSHVTRTDYFPKARAALALVRSEPVGLA